MSYKYYEQFKETDSNFFSYIPNHWIEYKLKFIIDSLESGKRKDFEDVDYALSLGGEHINWNGTLNLSNRRYLSKEFYDSLLKGKIKNNDILLVKDGATIGKTAYVSELDYKMAVNEHVFIIRNNKLIIPKLLYYLISSSIGFYQIKLTETGSAQGGISQDIKEKVFFPIPMNNEEQIKLVNFLDKKTSEIDNNISKNKELISLLEEKKTALINQAVTKGLDPNAPMKESGIEWIGEIPEHWKVKKVKEISSVTPSNVDKKTKDNEPSVLLCNYTDVYNNEFITNDLDFMIATASHEQIRKLSLNKGDIIITKDSETAEDIGVPAIVTEDLDNVVCGYHLTVIKPDDSIYNKFLFRCFESKKVNDQFVIAANGITRFGLSVYPIANSYVYIPPYEEQKEISTFLEKEISDIYKIIETIEKEIFLLKEYKDSLVHHVVTGKIDIRNEIY